MGKMADWKADELRAPPNPDAIMLAVSFCARSGFATRLYLSSRFNRRSISQASIRGQN